MARGGLRCPLALIRVTAHGSWDRPTWGVPTASSFPTCGVPASFFPIWGVPAASSFPTSGVHVCCYPSWGVHVSWYSVWGVPAAGCFPTWGVPAASCSPTRYFLDMSAKGKLWLSQLSERKKEYFYCWKSREDIEKASQGICFKIYVFPKSCDLPKNVNEHFCK